MKDLANKYSVNRIYDDYVQIYDFTKNVVEDDVLNKISEIASSYYEKDIAEIDIIFTILYMGMIAEENKQYTKLGKRITRLGIYRLLIENCSVHESTNFTRGMNWRDVSALCESRGF